MMTSNRQELSALLHQHQLEFYHYKPPLVCAPYVSINHDQLDACGTFPLEFFLEMIPPLSTKSQTINEIFLNRRLLRAYVVSGTAYWLIQRNCIS